MSYQVKFKGSFKYPSIEILEKALEIIDQELENPDDDFERNSLLRDDFEIKDLKLIIDFDNFISASSWYGCTRVLYKMSKHAIEGTIRGEFEGDGPEWISAGDGYN